MTTSTGLDALGLRAGEEVRFRGYGAGHRQPGVVARRERDGSVSVIDGDGATRSLPPERIEVRCSGPRGGQGWEPLVTRMSRARPAREAVSGTEQLSLF